jgi:hypothetical protein
MRRTLLVLALLVVLVFGGLLWLNRSSRAPISANSTAAPGGGAVGEAAPATAEPGAAASDGGKPEPDNSFIVCPGNPRCP